MDCSSPGFSVHGILQARILEWVAFPFSRDLLNPRIKPRSAALQAVSLPAEPLGKPKNTGVGSLTFPQGIFPTQELNQGLLYCRRILYQLSNQGSPGRGEGTGIAKGNQFHWRRQWHPTPVLLLGKSHGWRSLVGCSPWSCQESDMTE